LLYVKATSREARNERGSRKMYKRNLAFAVWLAAALGVPLLVMALQPASPVRRADETVRHPSLAAETPVAIDIGSAELGTARRARPVATGPIWMRGARLVSVPDDPRPMVVAQKPSGPTSTHAN
jgi:hypothetical protein